ncbi:uncharacterized protein LOC132791205 [Drosophila nasuta]|uniref:uncharacterized protein LOC132791205 n=1 Tax=Drosophila nasuta TaxID=42062 RepID=UPI00295E9131|nr:uncharacterized protein LOC132791205 [Drosophila nasuta]
MSKSIDKLPRDPQMVQALRRELNRNTRRISQSFWQEFEQIREQQRGQLAQEQSDRDRITTLMRETNLEAQQQLEALRRSISSHGINPAAPSPCMRREQPAIMPATAEQTQETKDIPLQLATNRQKVAIKRRQMDARPSATASPNLPRAPPSSRATIVPNSATSRAQTRSRSQFSKLKLGEKPKI